MRNKTCAVKTSPVSTSTPPPYIFGHGTPSFVWLMYGWCVKVYVHVILTAVPICHHDPHNCHQSGITVVFTDPTQASRKVNLAFKPWKGGQRNDQFAKDEYPLVDLLG